MRNLLVLLWALHVVAEGAGGETRGPLLQVRLTSHLTSYSSRPASEFGSVVIAPLEIEGRVVIPAGSRVRGTVRRASPVGLGLVRERAALELEFHECHLPDAQRLQLDARLDSIHNAREDVDAKGRVRGPLAASNPQKYLHGMWHRPSVGLVHRSVFGLTGALGKIWTTYSMGPVGAAGLIAVRCLAFRFPEPEIHLPPGTELQLALAKVPQDTPSFPLPPEGKVEEPLASWLERQGHETTRPDRTPATDIINLAFIGTSDQVQNAFEAAGWFPSEPFTPRSVARTYRVVTSMRGYPTAPVSKLLYRGGAPELVFQKSLNTIEKRHHIRIWHGGAIQGHEVWLAAATHDTGIIFDARSKTVTHKIDPRIDVERSKVVNDVTFPGCVQSVVYAERPAAATSAGGKGLISDGRLAVVRLRQCQPPSATVDAWPPPPGSRAARFARRLTLETRHYILRGSVYYFGYLAVRKLGGLARSSRPSESAP